MTIETDPDEFDEENVIPETDLDSLPAEGRSRSSSSSLRIIRTLSALAAVSHLGAAPILRKDFEELLYFIDCLLPSTGREVWEGVAIKNEESPLRPDWSNAIDSLVGYGLASVERDGDKLPISRHCEFDITDKGRSLIIQCRRDVREINVAWDASIEIGLAYLKNISMRDSEHRMIIFDETFRDARVARNDVIDYGEYESLNLSSDLAMEMTRTLGIGIRNRAVFSDLSPQVYLSHLSIEEKQQ